MARQWLPELFRGVEVDPDRLKARRTVQTIALQAGEPVAYADPREEEALECLDDERARRRVRGLQLLCELEAPDLFDWCLMFVGDESTEVRVAALRTMLQVRELDTEALVPLAQEPEKRVRAAALAALAKHSPEGDDVWYLRALKDPSDCVRLETAALLPKMDPAVYVEVYELARHDPNPKIAATARRLTEGRGYTRLAW